MELVDKVIVVSGGASGIGKATTMLLADAGARVVVVDIDGAEGSKVVEAAGPNACYEPMDLRSVASIADAVGRAHERLGGIDGLANVAGIYPTASFVETTQEQWQEIDDTNLRGSFFLAQRVARTMIDDQRPGAIVNVASGAAYRPIPGQTAYSASKGGVVAMSRTMAHELAPHRVRVNVIAPGATASETVRRWVSPAELEQAAGTFLPGRWLEPLEVARVVVFLLGNDSRAMTGAAINVNGGDYMPH